MKQEFFRDTIISLPHLGWDIPTLMKINSDGELFKNNAHGGDPSPVSKGQVVQFLKEEIKTVAEHLAMLRRLKLYVDEVKK